MEPSRPDLSNNPQQNVHLHMHHVCACQNFYPSTYYPPINYRTPSLISYTTTPTITPQTVQLPPLVTTTTASATTSTTTTPTTTRPYLQHYQYTQYNVGNQYNLPMAQLSSYPSGEVVMLTQTRGGNNRGERGDSQEENIVDRVQQEQQQQPPPPPPPLPEFEFGLTIPPLNEFFVMNNVDEMEMHTDNFIKFLERSCLIAEQIAYKNRTRPCFRNIQNLCIRTRTEILKPRTTIANIHSQGIPWATKDFIYAFIRLINCWHILKGYWENRNLINLNKIEKQLTETFKLCYIRWERETCQLATELTRIFFNLDFNQNNYNGNSSNNNNNNNSNNNNNNNSNNNNNNNSNTEQIKATNTTTLVDMKNATNETTDDNKNQCDLAEFRTATTTTTTTTVETVDQANQTNLFDFDKELIDNNLKMYMKPGSYYIPSKNCKNIDTTNISTTTPTTTTLASTATTNPCVIEFLETAQNINKGIEAMNDKYWIKLESSVIKKISEMTTLTTTTATTTTAPTITTAATTGTTTRDDELISNTDNNTELNFNNKVNEWLNNCNFSDYDDCSSNLTTITTTSSSSQLTSISDYSNNLQQYHRNYKIYENKNGGGLTRRSKGIFERIIIDLKQSDLYRLINHENLERPNFDLIQKKINRNYYRYVNEVVRDLRQTVGNIDRQLQNCVIGVGLFSIKFENYLNEYFSSCDFTQIYGKRCEKVGRLKMK